MMTQVLIHLITCIMCLVTGWLSLSRKAIPLSCAYLLEGHRDAACVVRWADSPVVLYTVTGAATLSTSYLPIQLQSCLRFPWANLTSVYPPWHTSYWDDRIFHHRNEKWKLCDLLKVYCSKQCKDSLEFFCRSPNRCTWIPRTWKKLQLIYSPQAGRKDELGKLRK